MCSWVRAFGDKLHMEYEDKLKKSEAGEGGAPRAMTTRMMVGGEWVGARYEGLYVSCCTAHRDGCELSYIPLRRTSTYTYT